MTGRTRYAIVGGGIVGASVAYHLGRRTDDPVTVYERGELAGETTDKATAMIGVAGPDPYYRMKEYGVRLYNEFFDDPTANPRYRQSGRLRVATTSEGAANLERAAVSGVEGGDREDDAHGTTDFDPSKFANSPVEYVPGADVRRRFLVPALDSDAVEGALHRPRYGYVWSENRTLGPRDLALEFVERARDDGVRFETGVEVTDIVGNDRVTGLEIAGGEAVDADEVILAAGPWNPRLAERAGLELPVGHALSPVFKLELDEPLPCAMPAIKSHESGVGLHPKRRDTVLLTYTPDDRGEIADGPTRYDPDAVSEIDLADSRRTARRWAERLMPELRNAERRDEWIGVGTTTLDGRPIVGRSPIRGLSLASTMTGIQYAPAVGDVVARQLLEGDRTAYYDAVSISRFDGYTDEWPA